MRANNQSKPQKKPPPQKKKQDRHIQSSDSDIVVGGGSKGKDKQKVTTEVPCNAAIPQEKGEVDNVSSDLQYIRKEDTDEVDWEDGYIPASGLSNHQPNHVREVVVEFDHSPSSLKKKSIRRASAEDKELAELVHRVHLLCLLARGRLVDAACDDPLIQAALLSLLPRHLLKIAELPKVTTNALTGLLKWFHDSFRAGNPSSSEGSFKSSLAFALENRQGTAEEVVALSVALFRALNLTARFVSILDVASLKPDSDMSGGSSQDVTRMESGIFNSSTLMVTQSRQASVSAIQSSSSKLTFKDEMTHRSSHDSGLQISENYKATQSTCNLANASLPSIESNNSSGKGLKKKVEKRKGDLEFELQMEMALSATRAHQNNLVKDLPGSSSSTSSPASRFKKIKSEEGISTAVGSRKVGPPLYWAEVFCNGENITGRWVHIDAVNAIIDGAEKVEAATAACKRTLRYVVAFAGSGAKDVTRRYCTKWYKIASKRIDSQWWDEVLAPLMRFESSATGGTVCLDEVGAITKLGSVDACVSGNIESSTQKALTDEKLSSEMSNQYGTDVDFKSSMPTIATRDCLEDMELQTRALTEPLPTNQQAYRSHPLYVIERWLTKYQVLRPKGPILGYCSSHPVYPRTCVRILQTEQRWLRDGLQIRAHENPAKMVKRSLKQSKAHDPESGACDDDTEGTIALYGKWQTEPLVLPHAENGIVPRNERGQVDVWSEKCLPPGTVHLRYPRLVPVAKRLEIDFAPAMVGFEFRNGRSYPIYEGIVVCSEFKDAIMEAYAEEEERRETEDKKRDEAQALSRWYQLLSSIITRQRLKDTYGDGSSSQKTYHLNQKDDVCGVQGTNIGDKMESNESQQKYVAKSDPVQFVEDHQHTFPMEDQTFDEESSVRTKLCPCGFVLQVEEL